MSESSLKSKATKGMLWNASGKIFVKVFRFIVGIILARLLMPSDFGLMGMIAIFIGISQTFIDSGMGSALVQKQNRTALDYSTVFVFNFIVSVIFYLILFFTAPLIAGFYQVPELVLIIRVLTINIIINALVIVQSSIYTIDLDFKTKAVINFLSVLMGGGLAIFLAYKGFGVWALVAQSLSIASISVALYWIKGKWKLSLAFSKQSFRELFGFGSKLLLVSIYAQILNNIYNITIGKFYQASELGYYNRAKGFTQLTAGLIADVLHSVTFPILTSVQQDKDRMISIFRRMIRMAAFFIIPVMTLLSIMSGPLVHLLLGNKWLFTIPLLQWFAFSRIFYPINVMNMNILNATGRSDLFLKVNLSKIPMLTLALIISIPMGVKAMVIAQVITATLAFFINAYLPGKFYKYGPLAQLRDMFPMMLSTLFMAVIVLASIHFVETQILELLLGSAVAVISYITFSYILKVQELNEVIILVQQWKR